MEKGYKKAYGIYMPSELSTIKKNKLQLQPLFEAFTNSLESIKIRQMSDNPSEIFEITIALRLVSNLTSGEMGNYDFESIVITDNGIGLNDKEFERLINLRDNRKNFLNKGTGRVQFLHFFDKTTIESTYKNDQSSTGFSKKEIVLSKSDDFIEKNAILRLDLDCEFSAKSPLTKLTFNTPLDIDDNKYYKTLTAEEIKTQLISHYLAYFCEKKKTLPQIAISVIIDDKIKSTVNVTDDDIPVYTKKTDIEVNYCKLEKGNIEKVESVELFQLKSFILPQDKLCENEIKLVSKGEIAKKIELQHLLPNDVINGKRYLFLLSGSYIDQKDGDTRGSINIISKEDLKKKHESTFFNNEEILMEDIEYKTNLSILKLHGEIEERCKERALGVEELKRMFLLNPDTLNSLKIKLTDTDDQILQKVYEADAKTTAHKDAEIKKQIKGLDELDTNADDYQAKLMNKVNELVRTIPLQNRTALTQYVARRKLVLEQFNKILEKETRKLMGGGRIDEDILHNLIFQQSSDNPENSDLWLIEEDFIYFKGFSERKLKNIELNGTKIFKTQFTEEEEKYLNSLGEKRLDKRPDVLLFPDEGKCLIIEFKAPEVNVSEHLTQMNKYASLIRNYTIDSVQINQFFGYLIGEGIEDRDVRGTVSSFERSYQLEYWFKPSEKVTGFDDRSDGSIYTEVIKYSTLLARAKQRNKIFIDKLERCKKIAHT